MLQGAKKDTRKQSPGSKAKLCSDKFIKEARNTQRQGDTARLQRLLDQARKKWAKLAAKKGTSWAGTAAPASNDVGAWERACFPAREERARGARQNFAGKSLPAYAYDGYLLSRGAAGAEALANKYATGAAARAFKKVEHDSLRRTSQWLSHTYRGTRPGTAFRAVRTPDGKSIQCPVDRAFYLRIGNKWVMGPASTNTIAVWKKKDGKLQPFCRMPRAFKKGGWLQYLRQSGAPGGAELAKAIAADPNLSALARPTLYLFTDGFNRARKKIPAKRVKNATADSFTYVKAVKMPVFKNGKAVYKNKKGKDGKERKVLSRKKYQIEYQVQRLPATYEDVNQWWSAIGNKGEAVRVAAQARAGALSTSLDLIPKGRTRAETIVNRNAAQRQALADLRKDRGGRGSVLTSSGKYKVGYQTRKYGSVASGLSNKYNQQRLAVQKVKKAIRAQKRRVATKGGNTRKNLQEILAKLEALGASAKKSKVDRVLALKAKEHRTKTHHAKAHKKTVKKEKKPKKEKKAKKAKKGSKRTRKEIEAALFGGASASAGRTRRKRSAGETGLLE